MKWKIGSRPNVSSRTGSCAERIASELHIANASVRSLLSALAKLNDLAAQFPGHPKLGGFAVRLEQLGKAIDVFSKRLK